ncbi:hypothetical protein [Streptomyces sp. TRM72054]|uniref:hypothetical protein n=1 Tax=Streptomyces sp. TRM72054 TaxID=2870562 RepID=UPI0027E05363|nr:hypothetical protein [Streptomyces sp. TRM72054]
MSVELASAPDGGGVLPSPRARVVPLSAPPATYTAAVERYLTGAGIAKSSARIYRISLTTWGWMLAGQPAPTGPARRGAKPPTVPVTAIDDPGLPEEIAGRTRGPLFLTGRRAPAGTATLDVCEETSRARLSYRRAEEIFEESTRLPANPLARPEDIENLEGWTLHRLRHSALTHDAENGTSTPMLLARSRHASVRSLERYARPGVDAVARHVAEDDPAAHRRG